LILYREINIRGEMNEEEIYNDIPSRYKECIQFPINYCQLSIEQKMFVSSLFCAKLDTEKELIISDLVLLRDDLKDILTITENTLKEFRGN
jgi:hypothetical protein